MPDKDKQRHGGEMTVREAGRLGGEARKEQLGHKGGQRVRELIEEGKHVERK